MQLLQSRLAPGHCLIEPEETPISARILTPDIHDTRQPVGTIVNVGTAQAGKPLDVAQGQRVIYNRLAAQELESGDRTLNLVRHSDILALVG